MPRIEPYDDHFVGRYYQYNAIFWVLVLASIVLIAGIVWATQAGNSPVRIIAAPTTMSPGVSRVSLPLH